MQETSKRRAILIAGPTASGKSRLALALAEQAGRHGHQCRQHAGLSRAAHPHGAAERPRRRRGRRTRSTASSAGPRPIRPGATRRTRRKPSRTRAAAGGCRSSSAAPGSTSRCCWRASRRFHPSIRTCAPLARARRRAGRRRSCTPSWRAAIRAMAARLMPTDPQRIVRALEVLESTGRSLAEWQREPGEPVLREADDRAPAGAAGAGGARRRDRCALRCHAGGRRAGGGAGAAGASACRASCRSCARWASRRWRRISPVAMALEEAVARAKAETRQYAKRQLTWLRRNMMFVEQPLRRNKWKELD